MPASYMILLTPFTLPRLMRWYVLATSMGLLLTVSWMFSVTRPPPIASPRLPVLLAIPDFTLTNQESQAISLTNLHGQIWVADIIFTRCPGPCPTMTQRMREIQLALSPRLPVKLVSLSADPAYDTPQVLREYGRRFGASPERWWFLTGDHRVLTHLVRDGFKCFVAEKPEEEQTQPAERLTHSTYFILVDQQGRGRAVYAYADPTMKERLLADIHQLMSEK